MNGGDGEAARRLEELSARLSQDLARATYPERAWVPPRTTKSGAPILDVLVVGAGQSGLAIAFGLARERVTNVLVVDENREDAEGPWGTFARMKTLRTPKHVQGPDYGIPSLSVRAFVDATLGPDAWDGLRFVPTATWAAYLGWYRRVLGLPVRNETRVGALRFVAGDGCFEVPLESTAPGAPRRETVFARKVVLATGIDGCGAWHVPEVITANLGKDKYAHTREDIDFEALRGKRIAVLGAGASAFDNAACALEVGAARVGLFFRRPDLVKINPYRWAEFVGFLKHHGDLDDADRWRFARKLLVLGQLPPADTYARAMAHSAFGLHPGEPWLAVREEGTTVRITTPKGEHEVDFVIAGAGFTTDLRRRPELAHLVDRIALWQDRHTPAASEAHEELARHPYLGPGFELVEKAPGSAPELASVFHFTFGCLPSLGFGGASISGMKYGLPRVVGGVTRSLYRDDVAHHYDTLVRYDVAELP